MPSLRELAEDARMMADQLQEQNDLYDEEDRELDMDFYFRSGQIAAYESIARVLTKLSEENEEQYY